MVVLVAALEAFLYLVLILIILISSRSPKQEMNALNRRHQHTHQPLQPRRRVSRHHPREPSGLLAVEEKVSPEMAPRYLSPASFRIKIKPSRRR